MWSVMIVPPIHRFWMTILTDALPLLELESPVTLRRRPVSVGVLAISSCWSGGLQH